MRAITSDMQAHLDQEVTTLCECWWIRRTDGVTKYFTSHDQDLIIGGHTYKSSMMDQPSVADVKVDMSVNNAEVAGLFITDGLDEADVAGRLYDAARVLVFRQNWADPSMTGVTLLSGYIGNITRAGGSYTLEFRSLTQSLALNLCSLYTNKCRSMFGDRHQGTAGGCRYPVMPLLWVPHHLYHREAFWVHVRPSVENGLHYRNTSLADGTSGGTEPTWPTTVGGTVIDGGVTWTAVPATTRAGTISVAVNRRSMTVTGVLGPFPIGSGASEQVFFLPGFVRFISGNNDGIKREIGTLSQSGSDWVLTTTEPFPFDVEVGDAVQLIASCDKTDVQCKGYKNFDNFRAENKLPGTDFMYKVLPASKSGGKGK